MKSDTYFRASGTHTNVGTSEETTIQLPVMPGGSYIVLLVAFHYVRTGGSASNYQPRLGQVASFSNGDINERLAYSATAVADPTNDIFAQPIPCLTDSNGRLYLRPGFDGSSDNDGNYELWFKTVRGS
mgnify:CR=1 FL=1|jgi:hypothetical protein